MSYTISISGHAADAAAEQSVVDALKTALADLPSDAGVTYASGSFAYAGSVSLLPEPPAPPAPTLAEAVDQLAAAVSAAPAAEDGSVTFTADEIAALHKAVADVETASGEIPTAPAAPAAADAVAL